LDYQKELENIAKVIKGLAEGKTAKISGDSEIYSNLQLIANKLKESKEEMNNLVKFNEKIIENALEESKEKLATVFESSRDGIVIMDSESIIIEINNRLSNLLKLKKEEILGKKIIDFKLFSESDKKSMANDFEELSKGKHYFVREYIIKLNGKEAYFEIHSSALRNGKNLIGAVSIVRDITEQKNAEIALKKSEEKFRNQFLYYKELDDVKNDFISLLSHELKSPLVPIISYSDLFLQGILGKLDDKQKEAIQSMKESANNLLAMIEEILDISRIERGTMRYNYSDFEISQLIMETINSEKGFAQSKGLKIIYENPQKITLNSDRTKVSRALHNLINNSIKFTDKGKITITAEKEKNNLILKVSDTGIGIPEAKKDGIFTKFYQADSSLSRNYQGTGIGLYNTRINIEELGGDVSFESKEKQGTTFIIKLPLTKKNSPKTIAIIGASPNKDRMSNKAVRAYLKKGYKVYPINPNYSSVEGLKTHASITQLNIKPEIVSVYTNPEITKSILIDIVKTSPKTVYFNPGSTDKALIAEIEKTRLKYERACSIMAIGENPEKY
jgi:PAS domain S-box-containing protein